jgi:hypothetical protein
VWLHRRSRSCLEMILFIPLRTFAVPLQVVRGFGMDSGEVSPRGWQGSLFIICGTFFMPGRQQFTGNIFAA